MPTTDYLFLVTMEEMFFFGQIFGQIMLMQTETPEDLFGITWSIFQKVDLVGQVFIMLQLQIVIMDVQ